MQAEIALDQETFKALAGEKRIHILKELGHQRKTQTELAQKLALSAPTIAEHLSLLKNAGLVEVQDDGHKWKYYALTRKGQKLLNPDETKILVLLATGTLAFIGTAATLFTRYFTVGSQNQSLLAGTGAMADIAAKGAAPPQAPLANALTQTVAAPAMDALGTQAAQEAGNQTVTQLVPLIQLPELVFLVLITLFVGLLIGYYVQAKNAV